MKVLLAAPRGFCAGVNMAIESLELALRAFGPPIYVYHEIVHNRYVVESFRDRGVVFVDDLAAVPEGAHLLFSAHGVAPEIRRIARPGAVVAAWTYGRPCVAPAIDAVVDRLYGDFVGPYWPPERKWIDDGYRSTFEIAYPILRRHGFPATVFLYSDFVGASDAMTWAQMKEMTAGGLIEIQPHSKSHANLTLRLPGETDARYRERIRREIEAPVAAIRDRLTAATFTFAYPYGDVNEWVADLLASQRVALGVTVTPGGNPFYAYPLMLRRTMVFGNEDMDAFRAKLVTFVRAASR